MPTRFLVGSAGGELLQHLAFAPRERFASRKMQGRNARWRVLRLPARVSLDRLIESCATISLPRNGFSMKSSAPLLMALTAMAISPCPEIMKIGAG